MPVSTQRSSREWVEPTTASTRRGFLAAAGSSLAAAGTGGCVGQVGLLGGSDPVSILAAGSLQRPLAEGLRAAVDTPIRVEAHGSVTVARLVAAGERDPDLVALADPTLFDRILDAAWHAEFATNALVVAHDDSAGGRAVASADRWFDPVLDGRASLGRTDPDLDPLGYRTLFAVELAADRHGRPDLVAALLGPDQIYPETSLLSRFESGEVDAAVVYRSMAVQRGFAFRDLPGAIDLGDPDRADTYASASYSLPDGTTVRGEPISYGVRARRRDERTVAVYESLLGSVPLDEYGFGTPDPYPRFRGSPPRRFRR